MDQFDPMFPGRRSGGAQKPVLLLLQGVDEVVRDGAELAPADKVRAARKVWELREQMNAQMAQHRKVRGALGTAGICPPPSQR